LRIILLLFFFSMIPPPPRTTLFPYTTLFRSSEIDRWVGPNRNDTFIKKLTKLKKKQLPLLYNPHTKSILEGLNLKAEQLTQRVLFKAQLYVPYKSSTIKFEPLNEACVDRKSVV